MKFLEFLKLNEDIPVGPVKNKELWLDYLKSNFKNSEGYFVTFVYKDKVGINPKSSFNTPIGIYTYPLEYIFDVEDVQFRGENKPLKIKVIKRLNNKVLSNDLNDSEYESKLKLLKKIDYEFRGEYPEEEFYEQLKIWEKKSRKKTNFGYLWNITREMSLEKNKENIAVWTKLLLSIGYDYVVDNGSGTIHPNEPTQAVFLNPKSYKVVGEEFVDTEARFKSTQSKSDSELIDKIQDGVWSKDLIDELIKSKNTRFLKLFDKDDNDSLFYSILKHDDKSFEIVLKYYIVNGKIKDIDSYIKAAKDDDNKIAYKELIKYSDKG